MIIIDQKIVSKSENRYVDLKNINPSQKATDIAKQLKKDPRLVQTILDESKKIISIEKGVIIVEHQLGIINIRHFTRCESTIYNGSNNLNNRSCYCSSCYVYHLRYTTKNVNN